LWALRGPAELNGLEAVRGDRDREESVVYFCSSTLRSRMQEGTMVYFFDTVDDQASAMTDALTEVLSVRAMHLRTSGGRVLPGFIQYGETRQFYVEDDETIMCYDRLVENHSIIRML
jgi:hypothetical protein